MINIDFLENYTSASRYETIALFVPFKHASFLLKVPFKFLCQLHRAQNRNMLEMVRRLAMGPTPSTVELNLVRNSHSIYCG